MVLLIPKVHPTRLNQRQKKAAAMKLQAALTLITGVGEANERAHGAWRNVIPSDVSVSDWSDVGSLAETLAQNITSAVHDTQGIIDQVLHTLETNFFMCLNPTTALDPAVFSKYCKPEIVPTVKAAVLRYRKLRGERELGVEAGEALEAFDTERNESDVCNVQFYQQRRLEFGNLFGLNCRKRLRLH